jgi:hypothetical protein
MRRVLSIVAATALLVTSIPPVWASSPYDQKLTPDQQILHVLNRLTFGPRPGDVEEVRRIGLAKWIELQLHPDQIPENPALDVKLKPLETLRMDVPAIVKEYTPEPQSMMMQRQVFVPVSRLIPQDDARKVENGTAEDRTAVLKALDPELRQGLGCLKSRCAEVHTGIQEGS